MSRTGGPPDPQAAAEWRRERRRVALAHHPDRGGDAGELTARLDDADRRYRAGRHRGRAGLERPVVGGATGRCRRVLRLAGRQVRRNARRVRGALPRSLPGARRYIDL